jgi:hypothetical protein
MNDSLNLLEADWDVLVDEQNWADLGKCLRAIIKIQKNTCQLSHNAYEIEQRIKVLEKHLNAVEPKVRFSIVGDIIYARRAIDASSTEEFGAAFHKRKPQ